MIINKYFSVDSNNNKTIPYISLENIAIENIIRLGKTVNQKTVVDLHIWLKMN